MECALLVQSLIEQLHCKGILQGTNWCLRHKLIDSRPRQKTYRLSGHASLLSHILRLSLLQLCIRAITVMTEALTTTDLQGALPLIARGKVRDLYEVDDKTLLFIATDRISAYDVIMENVRFFVLDSTPY